MIFCGDNSSLTSKMILKRKRSNNHMSKPVFKCIIVGESTVGKTQLLLRYTEDRFTAGISTVGVDFKNKDLNIDGTEYRLQIWDTAGQERFRNIAVSYYKKADGIVLVYDVSKTTTFEAINVWLDSIKNHAAKHVPIILIGNKSDLGFTVSQEEAQQLADDTDIPLFFTSAKDGSGVNEAFEAVVRAIIRSKADNPTSQPSTSVDIAKKDDNGKGKKKCCK